MFVVPLKTLQITTNRRATSGDDTVHDGFLRPLTAHVNNCESVGDVLADGGPAVRDSKIHLVDDLLTLNYLRRFCHIPGEQDSSGSADGRCTDAPYGSDQVSGVGSIWHAVLLSGHLHRSYSPPCTSTVTGPVSSIGPPESATAWPSFDDSFSSLDDPLLGYNMMHRYHASLVEAENSGFPLTDYGTVGHAGIEGSGNAINLEVTWKSAFESTRTVRRANLRFERACVLFNIAALESYMAAEADRSTKSGTDLACKLFQNAAGIFQYLRKMKIDDPTNSRPDPENNHKLCVDFSNSCLSMLEYLMLAQAQACMFEKVCHYQAYEVQNERGDVDSSKRSLRVWWSSLAKIAMGVAHLYEKASEQAASEEIILHLDSRWDYAIKAWRHGYMAVAQYWQSHLDEDSAKTAAGVGYGLVLGRLNMARAFVLQALGLAEKANLDKSSFQEYKVMMTAQRSLMVRSNQENLSEMPMRPNLLPGISRSVLVKAKSLGHNFFPKSLEKRLFLGLLPVPAMVKYNEFKMRSNGKHTEYSLKIDVLIRKKVEMGNSMKLEKKLDIYNDRGGIPDALWKKIKIAQEEEVRQVIIHRFHFQQQSQMSNDDLDTIEGSLRTAVEYHQNFRRNNCSNNLTNAEEASQAFEQEIGKSKLELRDARRDYNKVLLLDLEALRDKRTLLQYDKVQLDTFFPPMQESEAGECSIKKLRFLLNKIDGLRDLKLNKASRGIQNQLAFRGYMTVDFSGTNNGELVDSAIRRIEKKLQDKIKLIEKQSHILVLELEKAFSRYEKVRKNSNFAKKAEEMENQLETSYDEVTTIARSAKKGVDFHTVFLSKLHNLNEKIDMFQLELLLNRETIDGSSQLNEDTGPRVDDMELAKLLDMGIDADVASEALLQHNNDFERALDQCFS